MARKGRKSERAGGHTRKGLAAHAVDAGRDAEPREVVLPDDLEVLLAAPVLPPASAGGVTAAQRRAIDGPGPALIPADPQGARAARWRLPAAGKGRSVLGLRARTLSARGHCRQDTAEVPTSCRRVGPHFPGPTRAVYSYNVHSYHHARTFYHGFTGPR